MKQQTLMIRTADKGDANVIGQLALELAAYLRSLGDNTDFQFDATSYLRDGFGSTPAFSSIVAEINNRVVGYLLYHPGYDTDHAVRVVHVVDLYVEESSRGRGVGRALMEAAAVKGREQGATALVWSVFSGNTNAACFYERLGARYIKDLNFMNIEIDSQ
jgi:ribosomal protein S18 acetylase RimI-like enzyme